MCGIQGFVGRDGNLVARMNTATAHRGPDDSGIFSDARVALGHNRLSILDLTSQGHQPMQIQEGALQIVFNGEIYNFKELRKELEQKGEIFSSNTDTEVILRGYALEGNSFFKKMRGMWAFAIYDAKAGKLIFSRDPFGIKPLYYYLKDGHFAFSSELRGLQPVLSKYGASDDMLAHHLYFVLGYIPAPHSPFSEVKKLLPGSIGSFDLPSRTLTQLETILPYAETAPQTLEEALDDTVQAHFVSDVPVGVFYSGGIDSTLLLAKARELGFDPKAFFLNIPNRFDNEYALSIAKELGVTPIVFDFNEKAAHGALERSLWTLDEPFADSSYVPSEYLSSQVAITHKVVLSGEGGDEFFGGYHRHNHLLGLKGGPRFVPASLVEMLPKRARRAIESKINRDPYAAYIEFVRLDEGLSSRGEAVQFLQDREGDLHDALGLSFDQTMYLPDDLLFKIDRAGMRYGLEGRVPFLDKKFFAAVRTFSPQERHGGGMGGKAMLKDLLRKYLPDHLVERPKQGFSMPLALTKRISDDVFKFAVTEAEKHMHLVPLAHNLLSQLVKSKESRDAFRRTHPQMAYVLLMWGSWRKSFKV